MKPEIIYHSASSFSVFLFTLILQTPSKLKATLIPKFRKRLKRPAVFWFKCKAQYISNYLRLLPELEESLFLSISQRTPWEALTTPLFGHLVKLCSVSMADGIALMSALLVTSNDNIHKALVPQSLSESCWDVFNMLTITGIPPFKPIWKRWNSCVIIKPILPEHILILVSIFFWGGGGNRIYLLLVMNLCWHDNLFL